MLCPKCQRPRSQAQLEEAWLRRVCGGGISWDWKPAVDRRLTRDVKTGRVLGANVRKGAWLGMEMADSY